MEQRLLDIDGFNKYLEREREEKQRDPGSEC